MITLRLMKPQIPKLRALLKAAVTNGSTTTIYDFSGRQTGSINR